MPPSLDELPSFRVPPEALARWSLEAAVPMQEATAAALAFLCAAEHAATSLLPVPAMILTGPASLDPDGFWRVPRSPLKQFRQRTLRALGWMEQLAFFRERFPAAAARPLPNALFALAQTFRRHEDPQEAAIDTLVLEAVLPELEQLIARGLRYPPIGLLLGAMKETEAARGAEARRAAAEVLGPISGAKVWTVRRRLLTTATRAILGARPLLDELERGGVAVDRPSAARGFARRLDEAVSELQGRPVLPSALIARLAGAVHDGEASLSGLDHEAEAAHPDDEPAPR